MLNTWKDSCYLIKNKDGIAYDISVAENAILAMDKHAQNISGYNTYEELMNALDIPQEKWGYTQNIEWLVLDAVDYDAPVKSDDTLTLYAAAGRLASYYLHAEYHLCTLVGRQEVTARVRFGFSPEDVEGKELDELPYTIDHMARWTILVDGEEIYTSYPENDDED